MAIPKPHDPHAVLAPEEVERKIAEILAQPVSSLLEECEQLDKAHSLLRDALQEN